MSPHVDNTAHICLSLHCTLIAQFSLCASNRVSVWILDDLTLSAARTLHRINFKDTSLSPKASSLPIMRRYSSSETGSGMLATSYYGCALLPSASMNDHFFTSRILVLRHSSMPCQQRHWKMPIYSSSVMFSARHTDTLVRYSSMRAYSMLLSWQ